MLIPPTFHCIFTKETRLKNIHQRECLSFEAIQPDVVGNSSMTKQNKLQMLSGVQLMGASALLSVFLVALKRFGLKDLSVKIEKQTRSDRLGQFFECLGIKYISRSGAA